jgi:hypothetical protein
MKMLPAAAIIDHDIDLTSGQRLDHWVFDRHAILPSAADDLLCFLVKDRERAGMNSVGAIKHQPSVIVRRIGFWC